MKKTSLSLGILAWHLPRKRRIFPSYTNLQRNLVSRQLESAFQGSKCFQDSGPYNDLYGKTGSEIKKDERIKNSGDLSGFSFDGQEWELQPRTAFYDWLYIQAVYRQPNLGQNLENYNAYTDIEFTPRKSFNCQARSCALYVSLMKRQILENVLRDRQLFLEILGRDEFYQRYASLV